MGADELFGGYTKHRVAFKREGWKGLDESLEADWRNISRRNLARDDRVVSDHGRQLRTPYLDENVVKYVRSLPCWERYGCFRENCFEIEVGTTVKAAVGGHSQFQSCCLFMGDVCLRVCYSM